MKTIDIGPVSNLIPVLVGAGRFDAAAEAAAKIEDVERRILWTQSVVDAALAAVDAQAVAAVQIESLPPFVWEDDLAPDATTTGPMNGWMYAVFGDAEDAEIFQEHFGGTRQRAWLTTNEALAQTLVRRGLAARQVRVVDATGAVGSQILLLSKDG